MKKFLTCIAVLGLLPVNIGFANESETESQSETTEVTDLESEAEDQTAGSDQAATSIEDYYGLYERHQNYKSVKLDLDSKLADLSDEEFYDLALQIAHHVATGDLLEATVFEGYSADDAPQADPAPSTSIFAFSLTEDDQGEAVFTDINKEKVGKVSPISLDETASQELEAAYNNALIVETDNGRKLVYFYEKDKAVVVNSLETSQSIFVSEYTRTQANPDQIAEQVQEIVEYNESLN